MIPFLNNLKLLFQSNMCQILGCVGEVREYDLIISVKAFCVCVSSNTKFNGVIPGQWKGKKGQGNL